MDAETAVVEELPSDQNVTLMKSGKEDDSVSVDRGFTCEAYTRKFFVDDVEEQSVTKLPQVKTTPLSTPTIQSVETPHRQRITAYLHTISRWVSVILHVFFGNIRYQYYCRQVH